MSKPKLSINRQIDKSYQELYEEYLKTNEMDVELLFYKMLLDK